MYIDNKNNKTSTQYEFGKTDKTLHAPLSLNGGGGGGNGGGSGGGGGGGGNGGGKK